MAKKKLTNQEIVLWAIGIVIIIVLLLRGFRVI
jgi:hypothetical protein